MRYAIDRHGTRWDMAGDTCIQKTKGGQTTFFIDDAEKVFGPLTWHDDEPSQDNYAGGTEADWDAVRKPKHYHKGGMECWQFIDVIVEGCTPQQAWRIANIVKYLWRCNEKNGIEDVAKAGKYIDMLLKHMENKS